MSSAGDYAAPQVVQQTSSSPSLISTEEPLDERELSLQQRLFGSIETFPEKFKGWIPQQDAVFGLEVPRSRISGLAPFDVFTPAEIAASESTTSTSYVDLTTPGPSLSNLRNGKYIIAFGAQITPTGASDLGCVSLSINGVAASDSDRIVFGGAAAAHGSNARLIAKTLTSGDDNSVALKYRTTAGTNTFANRWLIAIRYGNA